MIRAILTGILWAIAAVSMAIATIIVLTFPKVRAETDPHQELLRRQQWIHNNAKECCPHNRCFPVTARPSIYFWDVDGYRSVVPIGKEHSWPFTETFGCAYEISPGTIRCLFRPPPEAS